ncbi:hypothetical protein MNBD_GAMMA09-323 [hydrothermal vent metagenome]|uniref:Uncharacterized protein n=1 Tax=hydrothermal vent metagenome TaxID=652676 RepID=A0A3B0X1U3_9ZZZZ
MQPFLHVSTNTDLMIYLLRTLSLFSVVFLIACSKSSSTPGVNAVALDNGSVETCYDVRVSYTGSNQAKNICTTREYSGFNGLGVNRFMRISLPASSSVSISATRTSGLDPADPDLFIYKNGVEINSSRSTSANTEALTTSLGAGDYVILINDFVYVNSSNKPEAPGFTQSLNQTASKTLSTDAVQLKSNFPCDSSNEKTVSGLVTFERVYQNGVALNYNSVQPLPIQKALVEVVCNNLVYSSTFSDFNGRYNLVFPSAQTSFIRVKAKMLKLGNPSWDFSVVDNTTVNQPVYAMDSTPFTETTDQINKDLVAKSGWTGSGYGATRVSAPFAILDTVRKAKELLITQVSTLNFPALKLNWSVKNIKTTPVDLFNGAIGSSFFDGTEIYLLGAENNDTDEFDEHVIAHEWGHYFEEYFSRSDSIGGEHTTGDILDIRLIFGESFGNALSAMILNDAFYVDTSGSQQKNGFFINMENNNCTNPGWYSECSVQSILYDIYDPMGAANSPEANDTVSLTFSAIYDVMTGAQRNTPAMTSIFSFIKSLKNQNPFGGVPGDIDLLTSGQNIDPIQDIYGSSQINNNPGATNQLPLYQPF